MQDHGAFGLAVGKRRRRIRRCSPSDPATDARLLKCLPSGLLAARRCWKPCRYWPPCRTIKLDLVANRVPPDELAQQLTDAVTCKFWSSFLADDSEIVTALRRLDAHLGSLGGQESIERWSQQALYDDPAWAEARRQARHLLPALQLAAGKATQNDGPLSGG